MTDAPPSPGVVEAARGLIVQHMQRSGPCVAHEPMPDDCEPDSWCGYLSFEQLDVLALALSTVQPTTGGGGDREAIARIIDPDAAWPSWASKNKDLTNVPRPTRCERALAKADAIIAPAPGHALD